MKGFSKVIATCALFFGLSACQTTEESWTEWKDISEAESRIELVVPNGASEPSIRRQARENTVSFVRQERWSWNTGAAHLSILPRNRYYKMQVHDKQHVVEDVKSWSWLKEIDLQANEDMVESKVNRLGPYHYLISDQNNAGVTCFVYLQMLRKLSQSGYADTTGNSGGLISAYDCQPSHSVSVSEFEQRMIDYVEQFAMKS